MAVITTTIDRGHARAAGGWIAATAALCGVPAVLLLTVGSPIPQSIPDLSGAWLAIQQRNINGAVVVEALAFAAWVIWLQLTWALLWEAAVNTRRLAQNLEARPAPFVAAGIRNLAVRIASGTVVITMATTSVSPSIALATPTAVTIDVDAAAYQVAAATPSMVRREQATSAESISWLVQPGDSAWSIAAASLGDGSRFTEIAALNPEIHSPRDVTAGSRLLLPAGASVPADREGASAETKTAGATSATFAETSGGAESEAIGYAPAADVEIVSGDHLWGISENRLLEASGSEPTDREVLGYVNDVISINAGIVEDPDLIYPGEVFRFPQIGDAPPVVTEEPVANVDTEEAEPLEVETLTEAPAFVPVAPAIATITDTGNSAVEDDAGWQVVAGVVASLVAFTGLVVLIKQLRHRREVRGAGRPLPVGPVERAMTEAANLPLMRWAGQELATLTESLDSDTLTSAPIAVDVHAEGIELLWEGTQDAAPHPWESTDGGAAWRLLYDADAPIPTDALPSAIPGLVTIGTRSGDVTTLVDLESFGSLAVSGAAENANNVIRSIAVELAVSDELASARVVLVGFELEGDGHFGSVSSVDEAKALALMQETVEQYESMIKSAEVQDSFGLRVKTGSGPDVLVVIASAQQCSNLGDLIAAAPPRRGVVLVVDDAAESARGHLTVTPDGKARLDPIGLDLVAAAMPAPAIASIAGLLDELDEASDPVTSSEDAEPSAAPIAAPEEPDGESSTTGSPSLLTLLDNDDTIEGADDTDHLSDDDDDDWERPFSSVVVRLLGEPCVPGFDDLKVREISLLGLLISKGGSSSVECVLDHLWADQGEVRQRKTLHNLESQLRAKVGAEVFPLSPSSYPLTTTATSDYVIFEALVDRSEEVSSNRAIELLCDALALVVGPPFGHSALEWARSIGIYDRSRQQIEAAGLRLVDLALDAGELKVARDGIQHALVGLGLNEPLYRAWMRVEAQAGSPVAVRKVFSELEHRLELTFDDSRVSRRTSALLDQLLGVSQVSEQSQSA